MKKNAIIIVQEAKSHILPALYLAELLKDEYDFVFCQNSEKHVQFIEENGFKCVHLKSRPIGYFEDYRFVVNQRLKSKLSYVSQFISVYNKTPLFEERQKEINGLLNSLKPELILIDLFANTNIAFFYSRPKKYKVLFFSPMLSVHPEKNRKRLNEGNAVYAKEANRGSVYYKTKVFFQRKVDELYLRRNCGRVKLLSAHPLKVNYPFIQYHFENVPELVLAPQELELNGNHRRKNQHYLGLCTYKNRSSNNIDSGFDISGIRAKKELGCKVILCAFGTYFKSYENHIAITKFITNLICAVADMQNVELVIGVNQNVIKVIKDTVPDVPNVEMFEYLPQLELLQLADVFITHGGLGSIKEGISYGVPMLVYPLDFRWDNIGNAYKVHQHGLGIERELRNNTPEEIRTDIRELLDNKKYNENIVEFKNNVQRKYTDEANKKLLKNIF